MRDHDRARRAPLLVCLALLPALAVTGCAAGSADEPASASGTPDARDENPSIDELRQRAIEVTGSFQALLTDAPSEEEMRDRILTTPPTPCTSGERYRISVGMVGDGVVDIEPFIDDALDAIEAVGLSTADYHDNYRGGDDVSVSGSLPDGQSLRLEATREKTTLGYLTSCSADQSLVDAMRAAADEADREVETSG